MGLPENPLGVLGLTFRRYWGAADPTTGFTAGDLSIAYNPDAAAPAARQAAVAPAPQPAWRTSPARLGAAAWRVARAVFRGIQASRMREARRQVAMYRHRLPRPTGADR